MSSIHLFPFERIEKGTNIIIYGAGNVGKEYMMQIAMTHYCNIVLIVDKNYDKAEYPFLVVSPDRIGEVKTYDYILIAMDSQMIAREVREYLAGMGVDKNKIISFTDRILDMNDTCVYAAKENADESNANQNVLKVAIAEGGGIGDAVMDLIFIKEIRKLFSDTVIIDYYSRAKALFEEIPFINHAYSYTDIKYKNGYDVFITMHRLAIVECFKEEKVKKFSEIFNRYCIDSIQLLERDLCNELNDNLYTQYALLKGKNRIEQCNVNNILDINRNTPSFLNWKEDTMAILDKLALKHERYITVCRATDSKYNENHPKLWPVQYYNELLAMIKKEYPTLKIIQVGSNSAFGELENVDYNLVGQTSLDEVKVILKYSILHIDCEGGLVHLKHFLNGRSVVVFGPTAPRVFGYEENINIRSQICEDACEWVTKKWTEGCIKGEIVPPCMKSVYPDIVFDKVSTFFAEEQDFQYQIDDVYELSDEGKIPALLEGWLYRNLHRNADIAQIYRRQDNFIMEQGLKFASRALFDKNLSDTPDEKGKDYNNLYYHQLKQAGIKGEYGNIYNIPSKDESFDVVLNFTLLQEKYPELALKELLRLVKRNGSVIVLIEMYDNNKKALYEIFQELNIEAKSNINGDKALITIVKH